MRGTGEVAVTVVSQCFKTQRTALAAPRYPLRFTFSGDARLNELVITWTGELHRIPFGLLADRVHSDRPAVRGHLVNDPRYELRRAHHCCFPAESLDFGSRLYHTSRKAPPPGLAELAEEMSLVRPG